MANSKTKSGDGFATGVILIIIGIFALCAIFLDIHIVWHNVVRLWPLILIIIGVCVLPINRWIRTGIVAAVLLGGVIGYSCMDGSCRSSSKCSVIFNDDWDDFEDEYVENQDDTNDAEWDVVQEFSEPYKDVKFAEVEVEYGAGTLRLGSPTSNLIYAANNSRFIHQAFNVKYDGAYEAEIKFSSEGNTDKDVKKQDNVFTMSLNTNPVWSFDLALGACDVNYDFSDYKVAEIDLEGGVCHVDLKVGTLYDNTKINVETGVSSITIRIPESAGCKIESDSALSNKSFEGFEKVRNGVYETPNYGSVTQNIVIELSCAISNVNIKRY